jgi:hypothetical protein
MMLHNTQTFSNNIHQLRTVSIDLYHACQRTGNPRQNKGSEKGKKNKSSLLAETKFWLCSALRK